MMTKILPILFLAVTACATPYQPRQGGGEAGFSDIFLSETTREIQVNGNKFTSHAQLREMAFLRAAEIARDNGYPFLAFQELESWSLQTLYETSGAHQQVVTDKTIIPGPDITLAAPEAGEPDLAAHILRADRTVKPQMRLVVEFHNGGGIEPAGLVKVSDILDKYARKYNRPE